MSGEELLRRFRHYPFAREVYNSSCVVWANTASRFDFVRIPEPHDADSEPEEVDEVTAELILVKSWARSLSLEQALSARAAERACKRFFEGLGYQVQDISITQPLELYNLTIPGIEIGPWRKYDIRATNTAGETLCIDVKSARQNPHGVYSNFFIKPKYENLKRIGFLRYYFAVLMPQSIADRPNPGDSQAIILGMTSRSSIQSLQEYLRHGDAPLRVDFKRPDRDLGDYMPPYLFDYPHEFYSSQHEVCTYIRDLSPEGISQLIHLHGDPILPLLVASGVEFPPEFLNALSDWEREFLDGLRELAASNRLSRPFLFFYLLKFFVLTVVGKVPENHPTRWLRWIYGTESPTDIQKHPPGLYDPLETVWDLVRSLGVLYSNIRKGSLSYRSFEFCGPGLLRGRTENRQTHTLLAYCGGCGKFPLVWGREETCAACGYLVCNKSDCHTCKPQSPHHSFRNGTSPAHRVQTLHEIKSEVNKDGVLMRLNTKATIRNLSLEHNGKICKFTIKFPKTSSQHTLEIESETENLPKTESANFAEMNARYRYWIERDREYPIIATVFIEADFQIQALHAIDLPGIEVEWFCSIGSKIHQEVVCGMSHILPTRISQPIEIVQAIRSAQPNEIILIPEGEHVIEHTVTIDKPLLLIGAGAGKTVLICRDAVGIQVSLPSDRVLAMHGLTIDCQGQSECALSVESGTVRLACCHIRGASRYGTQVSGEATLIAEDCCYEDHGACGIALQDSSSGSVKQSNFRNNHTGICAQDCSRLTMSNSSFVANTELGIELAGSAKGEVEESLFAENIGSGIRAGEQSTLTARNNTCEGNTYSGIALFGNARGTLEANTCKGNGYHGIYAQDQAHLTARNNTCEGNSQAGIALFGSAQGTLEGNTCKGNGSHGIAGNEQSALTARNNTCEGNRDGGISLFGSAQGTLEGNTCKENGSHGIYAQDQAHLTARNNTCEGNEDCGIWLSDNVQGEVSGNRCVGNQYGIYVRDKTVKARLNSNFCSGNTAQDIYDVR